MNDSDILLCICGCGVEAEYSAHGIRDGALYDEHWAAECWHNRDRHHKFDAAVDRVNQRYGNMLKSLADQAEEGA